MSETTDRVLAALTDWLLWEGYPPSRQELAGHAGLSEATVDIHLKRLRQAGLVTWKARATRGLKVVGMEEIGE